MGYLKVWVSKGKTVATLLDTEFPYLYGEGDQHNNLFCFKTMAYVQANILLCAKYIIPSRLATRQIIQQSMGPYIPIIAGSCRWYCPSTIRRCWIARELVEIRRHCHSIIVLVGAPSLLRLHQAVEMAAAMVTSVPSDSHPPPGQQRGCKGG